MEQSITPTGSPPLPPLELRQLVGPIEDGAFDNPNRTPVFPNLANEAYECVFDWGCGCGRIARQLIQQSHPPTRYVGVDLHRGMIDWCQRNLSPYAPQFEFRHHDVFNLGLNPDARTITAPFPVADRSVSLFLAWSVFTHVIESAAAYYLRELARVLKPNGVALTTWFLFDKSAFPFMQEYQNALFINDVDPSNAVVFDKAWLRSTLTDCGLVLRSATPPEIKGFQWLLQIAPAGEGAKHAPLPEDNAATGVMRPPEMPADAPNLGRSAE